MFRFDQPYYLYLLAIIPVIAVLHYWTDYRRRRRMREFGDLDLLKALMPDVSHWRRELKFWLLQAALAMMIVCLARPQYGTKIDTRKRRGIEAIVALDVSNSMLATDVSPSRLDKAKMLVSSLVDGMTDDKIGLIVYAGDAFTQLPITSDYVSAKMFLDNISPSMINVQGTDIARAIELATHSFTQQEGVGRAIFVITDGEDNEGGAEAAAAEALKQGMKVYVLGVGSAAGSPIPLPGTNRYITDNSGNTVVSKLNEDMCRQISQAGGGAYVYVDNSSSAISALQKHVDKLAKADMESVLYSEFDEHFRDFAWAALILLIIEALILARRNHWLGRFRLFPSAKATALLALFILPALMPSAFDGATAMAQRKNDRYFIRHGNRLYRDSLYAKAQVDYQKAIEKDNANAVAHYNLGNAHLMQGQPKDAMKSFETAARIQTDKLRAAQCYHNMGVIFQSQKQYKEAIQCYQNALRRNPKDDETRYNLALCMHQLKNDNNQNGGDDNQGEDSKDQQQQKQDQQQKQQQQQDQDQQQQQQEQPKMSKENAEQLLRAAQQEERQTQDKVNKAQQRPQRRQLEKQW